MWFKRKTDQKSTVDLDVESFIALAKKLGAPGHLTTSRGLSFRDHETGQFYWLSDVIEVVEKEKK